MTEATRFHVSNGIATLVLSRPERLNAFNDALVRESLDALETVRKSSDIQALILTGDGRGFCAGADLTGLAPTGEVVNAAMRDLYNPLIIALDGLGKPTVAAVNGVAAGAGVGLALACDITIAARSASFVLTFGPMLGLVPDLGCTWFLPRAVGRARARGLALLGDRLSAEKAAEWGLIWGVLPDDSLMAEAKRLAGRLARGSGETFAEIKRLIDAAETATLADQLDAERHAQSRLIEAPAFKAGVEAFLSKRTGSQGQSE